MRIENFELKNDGKSILIRTSDGILGIYGIADNVLRCVYTRKNTILDQSPLGIDRGEGSQMIIQELENGLEIATDKVALWIDKEDCRFAWTRSQDGSILLEEEGKELTDTPLMVYDTAGEEPVIRRVKTVDGERNFIENLRAHADRDVYKAKLFFRWRRGEQIHGLGQGEEGIYNYRHHTQYLYQHNMRIPIPFMVSDQGYAVLMDCGSLMTFNDDERGSYLYLDAVNQMDYYFIADDSMDGLIDAYRHLTGKASMLPRWAFGYIQSREAYATQEELVDVVRKYRKLGIGLDCVVQDWKTWPDNEWGCKIVDKKRYPDLKDAMDRIHDMHVHTMVSVWPNMNVGTTDYQAMEEAGGLLQDLATYNAFDPKAREVYWKLCDRELFSGGFDSWWCDSTEPFSGPDWGGEYMREPWERFNLVGGEHKKFLGAMKANLYALAHAKGMYENQKKADHTRRMLNLTRSGYAGIQKYGAMLWSGDICARWDVLKKQIPEALNFAMSGMPYWTFDIGGFFTVHDKWQNRGCECNTDPTPKWFWHGDYEDGVKDLGYRELYVRWFQMGAFLPMFRSHGTDTPREIWQFGAEGEVFYEALRKTIDTRYKLMPYIYSLAGLTWLKNDTMVRSLLFDYAEDQRAAHLNGEYMFGRSLLVCPITEPMYYDRNSEPLTGAHQWTVYLPEGNDWYDFYTGTRYIGGQSLTLDVDLMAIPVFVKAGSILPMEKKLTYADERVDSPLEIHIFRGADANFSYYEDAGDGYGYEEGQYNLIKMTWREDTGELIIGEALKDIPGGLKGRKIRILCQVKQREIIYEGREITVKILDK